MTNTKDTKRALIMSVLTLFICVSMLIGSTFAWFTDSVVSGDNIIASGNLDVGLYWAEGTEAPEKANWKDASKGAIFDYDNWEPGYVQVRHIKIANIGSLALKYKVSILANGEVSDLADVIDVYYVDPAVQVASRTALSDTNKIGTLTQVLANLGETGNGTLPAGTSDTITIAFKMQESAGNQYMNKAIGTSFSIVLNATQMTYESDSFDHLYDTDATNPTYSDPIKLPESGPMTIGDDDFNTTLPESLVDKLRDALGDEDDEDYIPGLSLMMSGRKDDTTNKTIAFSIAEVVDENANIVDLENMNNQIPVTVKVNVGDVFSTGDKLKVYHDGDVVATATVDTEGYITYEVKHFCEIVIVENPLVTIQRNGYGFATLQAAMDAAQDGDVLELRAGTNTTDAPLTETITVSKKVTLVNNGMYLVSAAPATFTVVEGGKLTVTEGSFTIKNTSTNGAAVLVDGGEFVMEGGSFDAHTAVRTTEGKSSIVTLAAGWSNRVTVSFDLKGDDTLNVTGGSIYSSAEAVKTTAGTHVILNMSGGLLSSRTTQYSAAVNLQCTATVNMTGGKIENTYSNGANGSPAIAANVAPTTINLSGNAALSSNGTCVVLGTSRTEPAVLEEKFTLTMSGQASISATSSMGFGIRYAQDACDVTISGNAKINATFHGIQFSTNAYVYTNSSLLISENATITSAGGRYGGGYAVAAYGNVTITGGTISGTTSGLSVFGDGPVVVIDNSVSGTPITINSVNIADTVDYTVLGNPQIG